MMTHRPHTIAQQRGFTLVELSMVLLVIGLIVGGILVGQSLKVSAGIRSTISQVQQLNAGMNAFLGKYSYLPGDIPVNKNVAFFGGTLGSPTIPPTGEPTLLGNGRFDDGASLTVGNAGLTGELQDFWLYLSTARMIEEHYRNPSPAQPVIGTNYPDTRMDKGGIIAVSEGSVNYWLFIGAATTTNDMDMGATSGMYPEEAFGIDIKLDDGLANVGVTQHIFDFDATGRTAIGSTAATATSCHATTATPTSPNAEYQLTVDANVCHLITRMQ